MLCKTANLSSLSCFPAKSRSDWLLDKTGFITRDLWLVWLDEYKEVCVLGAAYCKEKRGERKERNEKLANLGKVHLIKVSLNVCYLIAWWIPHFLRIQLASCPDYRLSRFLFWPRTLLLPKSSKVCRERRPPPRWLSEEHKLSV